MVRVLPFDYAVRNLQRRPLRTLLTAGSCALVAALIASTTAFVQGLGGSSASQGREDVAIVLSRVAGSDIMRSAVAAGVAQEIAASVPGIARTGGIAAVSPEIHVGTRLRLGPAPPDGEEDHAYEGFVRGVAREAFLVHDAVTIVAGRPPGPMEVLVGQLVPARLGVSPEHFAIGEKVRLEGGVFTVSGHFVAPGTTIEGELWVPVQNLKSLTRRADVSTVFIRLERPQDMARLELFTRKRLDLELNVMRSSDYYERLAAWFTPIQILAWVLAAMMTAAVLFGAANTLNAAVQDRIRELAALRAVGYRGFALVLALVQEGVVLAALGGLIGLVLARMVVEGAAVHIAMGAFQLEIGTSAVLSAFSAVLVLGILAVLPAAVRVLRMPVALALKDN
ncbi:MAG: ABC transporter permease [Planctomycetes bacterium]|nr:ABC transporter permease [Planctomycetota bacterium]